jgi:hypothetical protein
VNENMPVLSLLGPGTIPPPEMLYSALGSASAAHSRFTLVLTRRGDFATNSVFKGLSVKKCMHTKILVNTIICNVIGKQCCMMLDDLYFKQA